MTDKIWVADQEYCLLRAEAVVRIPNDVEQAEAAPLLCAGVTVFNAMRLMKVMPGEKVAIQGLGGLGHLALQFAKKMGFRVIALSTGKSKEKFARDLGATDYVSGTAQEQTKALQDMGGVAMIVSTASDPKASGDLLDGLQPKGKLVILARKSYLFIFPRKRYLLTLLYQHPRNLYRSTPYP